MFSTAIEWYTAGQIQSYSLKDAMTTSFAGWIGIGLSQKYEIRCVSVQSTKLLTPPRAAGASYIIMSVVHVGGGIGGLQSRM